MKIYSLLLITLSLCILMSAHTAQATYRQLFQKYFGKACTAIGFGIAAGPLWSSAIKYQLNSRSTDHPGYIDASKEVYDFCRKEIQDMSMDSNAVSVKVPKQPIETTAVHPKNGGSFGKTIVIDYPKEVEFLIREKEKLQKFNFLDFLVPGRQQKKQELDNHINQWRYTVQHEAAHIKNNDRNNFTLAALSIPVVTHACLSLIKRKVPQTNWQHFKKIPAGFAKVCLNGFIFSKYSKYREQKADDGVNDEKDVLTGGYNFMMSTHEDLTQVLEEHFYDHPGINPKISKGIRTMLYNLADPLHPTPIVRAQKLEQRLKKLEEQSRK